MGRGRAKAKQAKVARQLKYNSPEMDLERLQRELTGQREEESRDKWDRWAEDEPDEDDWR
ncbi:DUF3073 domain-containing protein [uncultured Corynebacterium sp.]|uniref:DUF3073 domain-containing protein n=1 Tax=uncultured Corynebacterium sp. TaxID=159447 RepID=UPI0025CD9EE0|nr:DUF3073 domain-containing protein [uncultured Corynebacterium sp.]